MNVSVPESGIMGLKALNDLSDNDFDKLQRDLDFSPTSLGIEEVIQSLSSFDKPELIIKLLLDLQTTLFIVSEVDTDAFIPNIIESAKASEYFSESEGELNWETTQERLVILFSQRNSIYKIAKARDLALDNKFVLYDSRILTDIRPLFGRDDIAEPDCFLIQHTLKLRYYENLSTVSEGKALTKYLNLDFDDLEKLKKCIDRALEKSQLIEEKMKKTGATVIGMR